MNQDRSVKCTHTENEEGKVLSSNTWMHPKYDIRQRSCQNDDPRDVDEDTDNGIGLICRIEHTHW